VVSAAAARRANLAGVLGFVAAGAAKLFGLFDRSRCAGWARDMKPVELYLLGCLRGAYMSVGVTKLGARIFSNGCDVRVNDYCNISYLQF
jgi:hypothetical protein